MLLGQLAKAWVSLLGGRRGEQGRAPGGSFLPKEVHYRSLEAFPTSMIPRFGSTVRFCSMPAGQGALGSALSGRTQLLFFMKCPHPCSAGFDSTISATFFDNFNLQILYNERFAVKDLGD